MDFNKINPLSILKQAIQTVPSVKYALGITGIASVLAIVSSFGISLKVAFFGVFLILILMIFLLIFAKLSSNPEGAFYYPARVLMWSTLVLILATSLFIFTSVFFRWPLSLNWLS